MCCGVDCTWRPHRAYVWMLCILLLVAWGQGEQPEEEEGLRLFEQKVAAAEARIAQRALFGEHEEEGEAEGEGRRLHSHVDEDEVLHLVHHEPVRLSYEEAQDWNLVRRKLKEARRDTGHYKAVDNAFVPEDSPLRNAGGQQRRTEKHEAGEAETVKEGEKGGGPGKKRTLFEHVSRMASREHS